MSRLKSQIRQTEAELTANKLYIQEQFEALDHNASAQAIFTCTLAGGLIFGFIVGRYAKMNTLIRAPMRVNKLIATYKLFF